MACPYSVLVPLRKTSVSGSENVPGWVSSKTLVSVTAYHSFGGEVEALNTPTIRRLTLSCRHQLSALALTRLSRPGCRSGSSTLRSGRRIQRLQRHDLTGRRHKGPVRVNAGRWAEQKQAILRHGH